MSILREVWQQEQDKSQGIEHRMCALLESKGYRVWRDAVVPVGHVDGGTQSERVNTNLLAMRETEDDIEAFGVRINTTTNASQVRGRYLKRSGRLENRIIPFPLYDAASKAVMTHATWGELGDSARTIGRIAVDDDDYSIVQESNIRKRFRKDGLTPRRKLAHLPLLHALAAVTADRDELRTGRTDFDRTTFELNTEDIAGSVKYVATQESGKSINLSQIISYKELGGITSWRTISELAEQFAKQVLTLPEDMTFSIWVRDGVIFQCPIERLKKEQLVELWEQDICDCLIGNPASGLSFEFNREIERPDVDRLNETLDQFQTVIPVFEQVR